MRINHSPRDADRMGEHERRSADLGYGDHTARGVRSPTKSYGLIIIVAALCVALSMLSMQMSG